MNTPSPLRRGGRGGEVLNASALRAFLALVLFSLGRQAKVRQMGWAGFALLAACVLVAAVVSHTGTGWRLEDRTQPVAVLRPPSGDGSQAVLQLAGGAGAAAYQLDPRAARPLTHRQYASEQLTIYQVVPGPPEAFGIKAAALAAYKTAVADPAGLTDPADPADPDESPRVPAKSNPVLEDFAFQNYSRTVVGNLFAGFLLPLFTLAYATAGVGSERESRTLLWLFTRPLPRWAVYLAKLLAGLPWCVAACGVGFGALCLSGGGLGLKAAAAFWPLAVGGAVAFGCVFHLVGALFRRPTVIGLVYVFFFETLVANLPGGLKQFSLSYYLRSLFYNRLTAAAPTVRPELLSTYEPADPATAWIVLTVVAAAVTILGAWLFGRQEPKDET